MLGELLVIFGTLFAIVNPISTSFVFLNLTSDLSLKVKRHIALRAAIAAGITLSVFLFIGELIMRFFGITIYAFRVAGGLYLLWIGFEMLSPHLRRKPENYEGSFDSLAIVPLAIPLLSGPGALTSVLVLGSEYASGIVLLGIVLISVVSWLVLYFSGIIQKVLGHLGTNVVERLMGIIVVAIATQYIFNGIAGFLLIL